MDEQKALVQKTSNGFLRRNLKTIAISSVLIGLLVGLGFLVDYLNKGTSLRKGEFETSVVSRGNVYNTVGATGEVVAENEVLLLCPSTSIVNSILRPSGAQVIKGELILTLDQTKINRDIEVLEGQIEMMKNNLFKTQLSSRMTRIDLDHDIELKNLKIASLKSELEEEEELFLVGGISQSKVDKTKQELVLARKELKRSSEKHGIRLKELEAIEKGLALQIELKQKELDEKHAIWEKMQVKAPGNGIVLDIHAREGEHINKDAILVRISEHTTRKIEGMVDDKFADEIRNGGKVFAISEEERLEGTIGNIKPELKDDKIKFDVFLEDPHNKKLRVNKKVKLLLVIEERHQVLRIPKGEYFSHSKQDACYVVEGENAVRKDIVTGMKGSEFIEIERGLDTGDVVITSNISGVKPLGSLVIEDKK